MASELEVGTVKGGTAELNGTDYHLKLQDGAGNPWYLRAPDDSFRIHRNTSGDALTIDSAGAVSVPGVLSAANDIHLNGTTGTGKSIIFVDSAAAKYSWQIGQNEIVDDSLTISP